MTAPARQDVLFDVPANDEQRDDTPARTTALKETKPPVARESDGVVAIYLKARGLKYKYQGAKDADAWKRMRTVASVAEIEERWAAGLDAKGWCHVDTLAQLDAKWNDLAPAVAKAVASVSARAEPYTCEACGATPDAATRGYVKFCRVELCHPCFRLAQLVADGVPAPTPPVRLGEPRIAQYQMAMDLAVSLWAKTKRGAVR